MVDIKQEFGKRLRELRVGQNISQEKLAERLNVCVDTIKNYEKGKYGPEFSRLPEIANALQVKLRDLLDL